MMMMIMIMMMMMMRMMMMIIIIIIIIMPVDRNVTQKSIKETKIQKFVYGDIKNVECEIHDYTCNRATRIVTKALKKNLEAVP
jgi:hypothetical protein